MTPRPAHGDGPTGPSAPTGRTEARKELSREIAAAWLAADDGDLEGWWEHAGRAADLYEEIAKRRAEEAERALAQARDAIATERRGRLAAEAAVRRVRALCWRGPGPANEYQIWTVDVLAALDAEQEAPGAERAAPIDWEAIVRQRERELKQVGEARHQAEAAVRRVKHVLAWKTLLAGPQAEKAVRVADVEAALDAEQPKETP
ncbi:hypothetical protein AB0K34_13685 [Actinomadura sp. NPDC049382]|uniref:hypothetical protein n=1 Tax=Actinomadura sp. NPDC049382 TaxID=3158220 RepID=UPI0034180296